MSVPAHAGPGVSSLRPGESAVSLMVFFFLAWCGSLLVCQGGRALGLG